MKTVWNAVKKLLIFGVILLLWYLGSRWHWWSAYVLPSPGKVFHTLLDMMASGELAEHLLISLRRWPLDLASPAPSPLSSPWWR